MAAALYSATFSKQSLSASSSSRSQPSSADLRPRQRTGIWCCVTPRTRRFSSSFTSTSPSCPASDTGPVAGESLGAAAEMQRIRPGSAGVLTSVLGQAETVQAMSFCGRSLPLSTASSGSLIRNSTRSPPSLLPTAQPGEIALLSASRWFARPSASRLRRSARRVVSDSKRRAAKPGAVAMPAVPVRGQRRLSGGPEPRSEEPERRLRGSRSGGYRDPTSRPGSLERLELLLQLCWSCAARLSLAVMGTKRNPGEG